jgi:zinc finger SWIM domain-containing protein 3
MQAMSGKPPETIFTYQCASLEKAIRIVFPDSCHRLCLWHIYQNAATNLSHVISNNSGFLQEFKSCVYEERSVAHFEMKWQQLLNTYKLHDNCWIQNIYMLSKKWATVEKNTHR